MIKFGKIEIISPLENNEKMKIKLENNFMESAPKLMEKMMKNAAIKIQEERDQDIIDTLIKKTGIEFKNSDELYYFIKKNCRQEINPSTNLVSIFLYDKVFYAYNPTIQADYDYLISKVNVRQG